MRRALIVVTACLLAACGEIGVPQVTPTVAPTNTPTAASTQAADVPSRTPIPTATFTERATFAPQMAASSTPTLTVMPIPTETVPPTATGSPTLTPSPSETPTASATPTPSPTQTSTPTPSDTNAPTATLTPTPTATLTATLTPTPTSTATATLTLSPTATEAPTNTPLPTFGPTETFTPPPPTATPTPTYTPSSTLTPLPTATYTPVPPTSTPQPTRTFPPDLTATWRAAITDTPQPTATLAPPSPVPTLDASPTFVTAAPGTSLPPESVASVTPFAGEGTSESISIAPTATPAPTVANVNPPPTVSLQDLPLVNAPPVTNRAFVIGPGGAAQPVGISGIASDPTLFIQNPQDPNRYIVTDSLGLFYEYNNGQSNRPQGELFTSYIPGSRGENNANVVAAAWSPDGRAVAFIVDAWSVDGSATDDDGVWYYVPGETGPIQLISHCPRAGLDQCQTVIYPGVPYEYIARAVVWSPDSQFILVELDAFDIGRRVLMVLDRNTRPSPRPMTLSYDYGDWASNGRLVVSGRNEAGIVILGFVNAGDQEGSSEQIVLNGSNLGLWLQNGVQRPDGSLLALGRQGDPNGAMRIYNQNGTALTGDLGSARPTVVKWSPDRSQVYVQTEDGRRFIAGINGAVSEITQTAGGLLAVDWISGRLPVAGGESAPQALPTDFLPSGVIEGSRFQPGQQLRVVSASGQLNVRTIPALNGAWIASALNDDYVAVLAGPVYADNVEWWRIQTAAGVQGWMAAVIDGAQVLFP